MKIFRQLGAGTFISLLFFVSVFAEGGVVLSNTAAVVSSGLTGGSSGAVMSPGATAVGTTLSSGVDAPGTSQFGGPSAGSVPAAADIAIPNGQVGANSQADFNSLSSAEIFFSGDGLLQGGIDGGQQKAGNVSLKLRQFGYDFFRTGGFMADSQALVGPDYIIGPGDSLRIDTWGNVEGHYPVTVDRNGEIVLPKVGVINLWGQTFAQAKETIRKQINKYFKNFEINVTMGSLRSIQVFLVGEVKAPGTYQISSLSTLVTALSSVGGPAKSGSLRKIQLLRNGNLISTIDLYTFFLSGDKRADMRLQSGDTIFVPIAGAMIGVAGNVRRPAIYELLGDETVQDALTLAGGLTPTAYLQKILINRVDSHRSRVVLDLNLDSPSAEALQVAVQDRDMIKVAPIALITGYVTLDGYVARPGNYQLTPGMHLRDLIINYDNLLPEFYPDLAQIVRISPPEFRPELLTINLESALQGIPEHNLLLQEYDTLRLFSRQQMEELPQVTVSGAVLKPGDYRLYGNMTIKDLLTAAGNFKRDAYLGEAELTRYALVGKETQSELITIDLDKILSGDPQGNFLLQPYDHLVVRAVPDLNKQSKVKILGKVMLPGNYTIAKGERLSSVLRRAGGFTNEAYLRGAILTRESAKVIQKQRMQQLIFEKEQEIARAAADIAAGAVSPEQVESAQIILASRQAALEKLRLMPLIGRMVVNLSPVEEFSRSEYDVIVMDGDTLMIPDNPKSVTVLGQVYNPISIIFRPGKSVSYYLSKVGGPTKSADPPQMFIIRADGSVISKKQSGTGVNWDNTTHRWTSGGFNTAELYAGDTLIVPEKVNKISAMRLLTDISTIFFQTAVGAAAVASF